MWAQDVVQNAFLEMRWYGVPEILSFRGGERRMYALDTLERIVAALTAAILRTGLPTLHTCTAAAVTAGCAPTHTHTPALCLQDVRRTAEIVSTV